MGFSLAPTAIAAGYRLEAYDSVGSTNAIALERGAAGDPGRLWLVTTRQETGRGRRGRGWQWTEGNLAATLLLVPDFDLTHAATLGFVAGLAIGDALAAVSPHVRFELKWPNDVLANGAKLTGILLESVMLGEKRYALAIGIGVNVAGHPEGTPYPATSLAALGASCDAETVFLALSDAWVDNLTLWNGGRGLDAIRQRWLNRAAGLGSEVAVRVDGNVVRGVFETIDEDCRFVIRAGDDMVKIAAGDVHFGAVASAGAA